MHEERVATLIWNNDEHVPEGAWGSALIRKGSAHAVPIGGAGHGGVPAVNSSPGWSNYVDEPTQRPDSIRSEALGVGSEVV